MNGNVSYDLLRVYTFISDEFSSLYKDNNNVAMNKDLFTEKSFLIIISQQ